MSFVNQLFVITETFAFEIDIIYLMPSQTFQVYRWQWHVIQIQIYCYD